MDKSKTLSQCRGKRWSHHYHHTTRYEMNSDSCGKVRAKGETRTRRKAEVDLPLISQGSAFHPLHLLEWVLITHVFWIVNWEFCMEMGFNSQFSNRCNRVSASYEGKQQREWRERANWLWSTVPSHWYFKRPSTQPGKFNLKETMLWYKKFI